MERNVYAPEAYDLGVLQGTKTILDLINRYCGFHAQNVQELIHAINGVKNG